MASPNHTDMARGNTHKAVCISELLFGRRLICSALLSFVAFLCVVVLFLLVLGFLILMRRVGGHIVVVHTTGAELDSWIDIATDKHPIAAHNRNNALSCLVKG